MKLGRPEANAATGSHQSFMVKLAPWLLTLGWMALIYYFSDQPDSARLTEKYLGIWNVTIRKLAHLTEYAVLCSLYRWSLLKSFAGQGRLPAFLLSVVYAALDEWHQSHVAGRSATLSDVLVDAGGALFGLALWQLKPGKVAQVERPPAQSSDKEHQA